MQQLASFFFLFLFLNHTCRSHHALLIDLLAAQKMSSHDFNAPRPRRNRRCNFIASNEVETTSSVRISLPSASQTESGWSTDSRRSIHDQVARCNPSVSPQPHRPELSQPWTGNCLVASCNAVATLSSAECDVRPCILEAGDCAVASVGVGGERAEEWEGLLRGSRNESSSSANFTSITDRVCQSKHSPHRQRHSAASHKRPRQQDPGVANGAQQDVGVATGAPPNVKDVPLDRVWMVESCEASQTASRRKEEAAECKARPLSHQEWRVNVLNQWASLQIHYDRLSSLFTNGAGAETLRSQ